MSNKSGALIREPVVRSTFLSRASGILVLLLLLATTAAAESLPCGASVLGNVADPCWATFDTFGDETFLLKASLVPRERVVTVDLADRMARHAFGLLLSMSADHMTTALSLKRCPNCVEANPLGFDVEARVALKTAYGTAALGVVWKLERDGHSTWAKIVRWIVSGYFLVASGFNSYHAITRR